MPENALKTLKNLGQEIWLDYVSRSLIINGDLARMIEQDGLAGITSNPTLFAKVIEETDDYNESIRYCALRGQNTAEIARTIMVDDIRAAADQFRTCYEHSAGRHGYVSLEVSPDLAHDTSGTIRQARELWAAVNRPNIFVKIPATREALMAIRDLTAEGVNVNATLLFSLQRYREVARAYIDGLRSRLIRNEPVGIIASVASFFISRIDSIVDPMLDRRSGEGGEKAAAARALKGKIAIACAAAAYALQRDIFQGPDFAEALEKGGRPQKLLWASMGTKNPAYGEGKYVDALIGPNTIATLPPATIKAYREHGNPAPRIDANLESARQDLQTLTWLDIDIDAVTHQLEREGIERFSASMKNMLNTIERKKSEVLMKEAILNEQIGIA